MLRHQNIAVSMATLVVIAGLALAYCDDSSASTARRFEHERARLGARAEAVQAAVVPLWDAVCEEARARIDEAEKGEICRIE